MGLFGKIKTAFSDFTEDIVQDEPQQATTSTESVEGFAGQNHIYEGEATQANLGNVQEGEMEYVADSESSTTIELAPVEEYPGDMVASNDDKPEDANVQLRTADLKEPGVVGEPFPVLEPGYEFDDDSESVIDVSDVEAFSNSPAVSEDDQEATSDAVVIEGHELWEPESAGAGVATDAAENVSDYVDEPIDLNFEEETYVDEDVHSDEDAVVPLAPLSLKIDSHYLNDYRSESLRPTAVLASAVDTVSPVVVDDPDDVGVFVSDSLREEAEEEELATVEVGSLEEEPFKERGGDEETDEAGSLDESFEETDGDIENDGVSIFDDADSDEANMSNVTDGSDGERFAQVRFDSVGFVRADALEADEPLNLIDADGLNESQDNELGFSSGGISAADGKPELSGSK